MLIKDPGGQYELRVDKARRIVFEINAGSWDADTYIRYGNEYLNKICGILGPGKWLKCVDLRKYKPNTKVTPELVNAHMEAMIARGFDGAACLLDSATLKMQINRAGGKMPVDLAYFDNEADAEKWLKSRGF